MSGVDISVVIPCRNGAAFISKQLDALLSQQTDAKFEVIIADNGSTDDTAAIVASYAARDPRLRLTDASRAVGVNVARNAGIAAARGGIILLTDADDLVHPGWIQAYWAAFRSGTECGGGALNRVLADGTLLNSTRQLFRSSMADCLFANGTNCAFTLDAFHAVDGFDESFAGGADEVDFFWRLHRAGYRAQFVAGAVVDKLQHTDLSDLFQQHFNFGRGEMRLAQKVRPHAVRPIIGLAASQVFVWGLAWSTSGRLPRGRRKALRSLAFNLGVLSEGIRVASVATGQRRSNTSVTGMSAASAAISSTRA